MEFASIVVDHKVGGVTHHEESRTVISGFCSSSIPEWWAEIDLLRTHTIAHDWLNAAA